MNSSLSSVRSAAALLLLLSLAFSACSLRETQQETAAAPPLTFHISAIDEATLGGLDVRPLHTPADLNLEGRNQLIAGYVNKELPLRMRVQLSVANPGLEAAQLGGADYTVLIDEKPLGTGHFDADVAIPARDSTILPLQFELNTYRMLGTDALPKLRNFPLDLANSKRKPPRLTLAVRPLLRDADGRLTRAAGSR